MACGTKQCNWRISYFRDAYLNTCDPVLFSLHCRLDCLRKVLQGRADFGIFQAEDIVVASSYKNSDVLITNEIRMFNSKCRFKFLALTR
jgi:hypothetical protein